MNLLLQKLRKVRNLPLQIALIIILVNSSLFSNLPLPNFICNQTGRFHKIIKDGRGVKFVRSIDNKVYLVKQITRSVELNLKATVAESHAAAIARSIGLSPNFVKIIPFTKPCKHKLKGQWTATIHSYIEGDSLRHDNPLKFSKIKQWNPNKKKYGLTYELIQRLSEHKTLPQIAAFDSFIGNVDRHRGNLIYNRENDNFYLIDHTETFEKPLCKSTLENLKRLIANGAQFDENQKQTLRTYCNTLRLLIKNNPLNKLKNQVDNFVKNTGLKNAQLKSSDLKRIQNIIKKYKKVMTINFAAAKELVEFLEDIL